MNRNEATPRFKMSIEGRWGDEHAKKLSVFGELDVIVPDSAFAKEPNRLIKWAAGVREWPTPARDECHMRKRALASVPYLLTMGVLWVLAVVWYLLLAGAYSIAGLRGVEYRGIVRPLRHDVRDWLLDDSDHSSRWFFGDNDPEWPYRRTLRHPFWWVVNPLTITICVLAGLLVGALSDIKWLRLLIIGLPVVAGVIVLLASTVVKDVVSRLYKRFECWRDERAKARRQAAIGKTAQRMATISCSLTDQRPKSPSLPAERRVQYLFMEAKNKVCKPFAGTR